MEYSYFCTRIAPKTLSRGAQKASDMENKTLKRLPVGIQTYSKLVEQDCLYIDKTEYIWKMMKVSNNIFLSRPRRFGKSLLVSTLQAYFEGRRELFKGLYIDKVEKEWTEYPVLRFDMSTAKHLGVKELELELSNKLSKYEQIYGKGLPDEVNPNQRLQGLIERAHAQTGQKVVVLIDEYDAPLLDVVHHQDELEQLRNVMRNFYSPLKFCDPHLHFLFLTGITKFSQLSIFSELNNLVNISMEEEFAAVCGITVDEVLTQMPDYLDRLAAKEGISCEETLAALKRQYDGYHFTWPSPDIFNPFSLILAFTKNRIGSYWFESGTPTFLIEKLREFDVVPSDISHIEAMASEFDAPTESMTSVIPLLYQSGYVTIKDYDPTCQLFTLDIPNKEIKVGLMESLLPNYVNRQWGRGLTVTARMNRALLHDDIDEMLRLLQAYLLTIPYCDNTQYEGHYQQLLYVIFSLLGRYVDVEVHTSNGRIDVVMNTGKTIYLFELKLNKSAEVAMQQINAKNYASKYSLSGLPVIKVGINFDAEKRTLGEWQVSSINKGV